MACVIMLLCGLPSFAATLESYQSRIESAAHLAVTLEATLQNSEVDHSLFREFVSQIRRDFPTSERVEWYGGSAEISNAWLLERVTEFEKDPDVKSGLPVAAAIREYLSSLSYKLNELERTAEEGRSKDEDKQKLGEILRREEYQKAQPAEESVIQRWLRSVLEWILDLWPKPVNPVQGFTGMETFVAVLRILLYVALIVILGFLIFKIVPVLMPRLKRKEKPKKKTRVILGEQIAEDQAASDLFSEAERLAREGDLRSAIRKGYIALLCDLSDRRIIGLARNKTNRDYLRDVRSRRDLHARMQSATDMFERHWYGFQESQPNDWTRFTEEYREAVRIS